MSIINVWRALSPQKQIASVVSVLATIGALFLLTSTALTPDTDLLYSGLEPAAAGEVVARLEALDVIYEVKGNAIYADKSRRDSLRLELARDGLPRQSVVGYELFDNLNSFAMTSDMFDTAYWRAKEGELARTLVAMPNIRTARVHLGTQKATGFTKGAAARSGSVTIASSGGVSPAQAKAIQYLTALSVSGLNPSDVAVIDTVGGVIAGPGIDDLSMKGGMGEIEQAAQIKADLVSMLEARVGRGNARVSVSLDFEREHSTTAERRFDPDGRVVKSQTTNEVTDSATGTNNSVTVASNLPEGEAGGNQSNADRAETSETVSYEISEIVKNTEILPGGVKRMTVAVLLNDIITRADDGTITRTPRSADELSSLEALVASAAGLNEDRGDSLTIRSLAYEVPPLIDGIESPGLFAQFLERYLWSTVQALILALTVLILALFVVRPLLSQKPGEENSALSPLSLSGPAPTPGLENQGDQNQLPSIAPLGDPLGLPFAGDAMGGNGFAGDAMGGNGFAGDAMAGNGFAGDAMAGNGFVGDLTPDPIEMLKTSVSDHSQAAADLLAQWLEQDEAAAEHG